MAADRRLRHVASAIALLSVMALPYLPGAGQEQTPFPPPPPLPGAAVPDLPRLHAVALPRHTARSTARDPAVARNDASLADHAWATGLLARAVAAGAPRTRLPSDVGVGPSPPGTVRDPDDRRLPRLMVCDLDNMRGLPSAADALQECIRRAPAYSSIEIPPGTYVLDRQVVVSTPLTIRTAGSGGTPLSCSGGAPECAVLVAGPDLLSRWGPLVIASTNNVTLEHLVIDGNRAARAASTAARFCLDGDNGYGFNVSVLECLDCTANDVVSRNALCGTAMVWSGARATIQHSAFIGNGSAATRGMWADGLTAVHVPHSLIRGNQFVDNSDIALIIGYAVQTRVEENMVRQRGQPAFAGLMLDNFNSDNLGFLGDFRGAVVAHNTIDCGAQLCVFGIQVGPRPWYPSKNIIGGELRNNDIRGAKIGINVDGAGIWRAPTAIFGNTIEAPPAGSYFSDCATQIPAGWMNVAPSSVVDRRNEATQVGSHLSEWCQLFSGLSQDPSSTIQVPGSNLGP